MKQINKDIKDFLGKHYLCSLATVDAENKPNVSVVYYYFDDNFNFYFVTRKAMSKYKNLLTNQNVAFLIYDEAKRISAQLSGVGEIIEVGPDEYGIINKLLENGHQGVVDAFVPLISLEVGSPIVLFKIKINQIKWLTLGDQDKMKMEVIDLP